MSRSRTRNAEATRPRGLLGNPEWEAMKARLRNLSHDEAARECSFLSMQYRRMWKADAPIHVDFNAILDTLRAKRIPFVLTGIHGISGWTGRPRATHDVDILVRSGRNHTRAVNAVRALYPGLEVRQLAHVTEFYVPGENLSAIDVMCPYRADLEDTLQTALWVRDGTRKYRIPTLECALANKYGAMRARSRDVGTRCQDAVEFACMVKHAMDQGRQAIDLGRLAELGEKAWPGGGGEEILRFVQQIRAGKMPNINALGVSD